MKVGYVALDVEDAEACRRFWVEQIGRWASLQGRPSFAFSDPEGRWFAVIR